MARYPQDFGFAVVDINGDGLADLVRNHWQRTPLDIGCRPRTGAVKFCLSNGTTWISVGVLGLGRWRRQSENSGRHSHSQRRPTDITTLSGTAFVDLDGDGLPDFSRRKTEARTFRPEPGSTPMRVQ